MPSATPEKIGREAAQAIADAISDGLEGIILKLADSIASLRAEQEKQADAIRALSNRVESLTRATNAEHDTPHLPAPGWRSSGR